MQGQVIETSSVYQQLAPASENTPPSEPIPARRAACHLSVKGEEWHEYEFQWFAIDLHVCTGKEVQEAEKHRERQAHERERTLQERVNRPPTNASAPETRRPPSVTDKADNDNGDPGDRMEAEDVVLDDEEDEPQDEGANLFVQLFSVADDHARASAYRQY